DDRLLPESIERLVVEEARLERDAAVVRRVGAGAVLARHGRPVGLDVLGALVRHGRAIPALLRIEVVARRFPPPLDVEPGAPPRGTFGPRAPARLLRGPALDLVL